MVANVHELDKEDLASRLFAALFFLQDWGGPAKTSLGDGSANSFDSLTATLNEKDKRIAEIEADKSETKFLLLSLSSISSITLLLPLFSLYLPLRLSIAWLPLTPH